MKRQRSQFSSVFIPLIVVLGGFFGVMYVWEKVRYQHPVLHAGGGTWSAEELSWTESDGYWRMQTVARLKHLSAFRLSFHEAVSGLCRDILADLPAAPDGVDRNKVYRVSLNLKYIPSKKDKPELAFDKHLPIQIKGGACQVKGLNGRYYSTYPGNLDKWDLYSVKLEKSVGEARKISVKFRRQENTSDTILPFADACKAFFDDPSGMLTELREKVEFPDDLNGVSVVIEDYTQYGPDNFHFHKSKFKTFQFLNDGCILVKHGEGT